MQKRKPCRLGGFELKGFSVGRLRLRPAPSLVRGAIAGHLEAPGRAERTWRALLDTAERLQRFTTPPFHQHLRKCFCLLQD